MKNNKAVSETIGNLLILVVVAITLSILLSYGYPAITSGQEKVKIRNVLSSMVSLREKMEVVTSDAAPSMVVNFPPSGGGLSIQNYSYLEVYFNGVKLNLPNTLKDVVYTTGNKILALELGGIFERDEEYSFVVYPPLISKSKDTVAIDIVYLNGSGSVGGYGIAHIDLSYVSSKSYNYSYTTPKELKLYIRTKFCNAWKNYLEKLGFSVSVSGDEVQATSKIKTLKVAIHRVYVSMY